MPTLPVDAKVRPSPVLSVQKITAGYGRVQIVRDVSVEVGGGEVVAIVGPNGAGKSTLLKAIMGLIHVWSGDITVGTLAASSMATERLVRGGVGYVPQVADVFTPLSVSENLDIGGYILSPAELARRRSEVIDVFPRVGLPPPPHRRQVERRRAEDGRHRPRAHDPAERPTARRTHGGPVG